MREIAPVFGSIREAHQRTQAVMNIEPTPITNSPLARFDILKETAPLTLTTKRAEGIDILERAKAILDAVPARFKQGTFKKDDKLSLKMEYYRFTGRRSRGPCPGCIASTEENHHGGSKCTRRGQKVGLNKKQTIVQFPRVPNIIPFPPRTTTRLPIAA